MDSNRHEAPQMKRREFLSQLSAAVTGSTLALAAAQGQSVSAEESSSPAPPLPTIRLGEHNVTRLVVGSNPISGYSYMGPIMDRHMKEYFTPERIAEFLQSCEQAGINTHQFSHPKEMGSVFQKLRERGSKMKFICLHSGGGIEQVVRDTGPIAMAHHGGATDLLFRQGKSEQVHDFVKRVHDAGLLAGVSAHNPACIKRIADEGWQVDFFMTCFYYLTRTSEESARMPPGDALPKGDGYSFFASDPLAMTEVARQVKQPCLGFKILGAGRKCDSPQSVRGAFKFAFERLKPIDGVIVGMYPHYQDQISENAGNARQFGEVKVQGDPGVLG